MLAAILKTRRSTSTTFLASLISVPFGPVARLLTAPSYRNPPFANSQPTTLPSVQERWNFIELTHRKAPWFKLVPMLGSMGCPYSCSFCIDSVIPYQPLDFDIMKSDLRFY